MPCGHPSLLHVNVSLLQRSWDRLSSRVSLIWSFLSDLPLLLLLLPSAPFVVRSRYNEMYIHGLPSRFNHCVEATDLMVGMPIPVAPSRRMYLACFIFTVEVTCLIKCWNCFWGFALWARNCPLLMLAMQIHCCFHAAKMMLLSLGVMCDMDSFFLIFWWPILTVLLWGGLLIAWLGLLLWIWASHS